MQIKEKTRQEIEAKASGMSDFLKMEYLEACIKNTNSIEAKKFCHSELARLYEAKNMFLEAARNMSSMAEMAITFNDKMQAYIKETELWIKAARYDDADEAFRKALASGNTKEKEEMKSAIKELYKKQALAYEKANKKGSALKIYEKLFSISSDLEKEEIKNKLLYFYEKLGKIREYNMLKSK